MCAGEGKNKDYSGESSLAPGGRVKTLHNWGGLSNTSMALWMWALGCQQCGRKQCVPSVLTPVPNQPRVSLPSSGALPLLLLSLVVVGGTFPTPSHCHAETADSPVRFLSCPYCKSTSGLAVKRRQRKEPLICQSGTI